MERYRSGHNEAVLKTVWVKARVGSNPTLSAKMPYQRGVAQFGSASGLGPEGRGFKSCRPDLRKKDTPLFKGQVSESQSNVPVHVLHKGL